MSNIDVLTMAVRNMFKRKLRTFLTVLGVIIGTAAIVIMISLGIAMNEKFQEQIDQMGDMTIIRVRNPNYYTYDGVTAYESKSTELTDKTVTELKKIKGVKTATPLMETYLKFVSGKYVAYTQVYGIDPSAMDNFSFKLAEGRLLDGEDENSMNIVFGGELPYRFYNPGNRRWWYSSGGGDEERDPPSVNVLSDRMQMSYDMEFGEKNPNSTNKKTVRPYNVKCVGVLELGDWETDYYAFMPIKQVQKLASEKQKYERSLYSGRSYNNTANGYEYVWVKCDSMDEVLKVKEAIEALGFSAYSNMDYIKSMQEIAGSLQAMLGAIGAVSLFVAAIGITNTMIMAIYERTKEIGVMKVIGAQIKDIKKLFLIEAMLIGFFGGIFGIAVSLIGSNILNNFNIPFLNIMSISEGGKVSSIPLWLCAAALAFSSVIGLVSGYFPARRAMRLSALSAIRTE